MPLLNTDGPAADLGKLGEMPLTEPIIEPGIRDANASGNDQGVRPIRPNPLI